MSKYDHVRKAKQTRAHVCHWTGCTRQTPPAMWGCREHWFKLPKAIRDRIWATYREGQEEALDRVTPAYLEAAKAADEWIRSQEPT